MDAATFWGLVITVVGTVASLWGAVISLKQAKAAKESADEAGRVRGQLINQRKTSELSELKVHCERTIKCMEKYGPSAAPASVRGVRSKPDADEVQNLILEANKIKEAFLKGEVDVFVSKVTPLLERFVNPAESANVKLNGQAILMESSSFLSVVKVILDAKRENVDIRA